jgi:hypothetical protein
LAKNQPGLRAIILDLPEVCQVAKSFIEESDAPKDKVLTYACNMFNDPFPSHADPLYGYQAVLLSQVLHDWDDRTCKHLCQKIFDSLPSKGVILIHEALLNEDGNGPLTTALLSFDMFLTSQGKQFTFNELKEILEKCGFSSVQCTKSYGLFSILYAIKP